MDVSPNPTTNGSDLPRAKSTDMTSSSPPADINASPPQLETITLPSPPLQQAEAARPSQTTAPRTSQRPKRIRCRYSTCKAPAQPLVGTCHLCLSVHCGKHRLLEDHNCSELSEHKKTCHQQNASKLASERTVSVKIR